ncbi:TPA: ead/Ea22-like family protein [Enterobacter asburiae]|nr:ead/Ea22-like family protein [Enterobacter asburiae]
MSNIDKQALRERYSAKSTPKCDICGAKMTIQRMSGSRVTYGCSGAIYDETGCHYAEGRSLADDHYGQSRVTVTDESDPDVLALLDELEAAERQNGYLREQRNEWERKAISNFEDCSEMAARIEELESQRQMAFMTGNRWADKFREAEKRIAELEALEVRLPPTIWYDCDGESQEIAVLEKRLVEKALSDAGLKIAAAAGKGE